MVMAPEHALVPALTTPEQAAAVRAYVDATRLKSDLERTELTKEKTGVFTGSYAINPVNGTEIPIWISDYILASYGTGAIMAVPGHDERDWEFATKFSLPILKVVAQSPDEDPAEPLTAATPEYGYAVNSGQFDGMPTAEAKSAIIDWLEERGDGKRAVNYKLRDWIFSRQRYWGEPIPLVQCDGEYYPVPYDQLPVTLPEVESYKPTGTGESPLAAVTEWVECPCPDGSGRVGRRETNTMPQWAGSCWYYLRYLDPHNENEFAERDKIDYWMPVDLYVGGAEHAVLHLLYSRFWHKVLYDIGVVTTEEPFLRLVNQGMILGENGVKMSKSLGNVINPDDIIREFGADSMRVYEMFMGPLQQEKPWSTQGLTGVYRFLDRVWRLTERDIVNSEPDEALLRTLHKTIRKVGEDTERLAFNTAISQMMILVNELYKRDTLPRSVWEPLVKLLSPYAPHLAEELWEMAGNEAPVSVAAWPFYDEALTRDEEVEVVVQINGKIRARLTVEAGTDSATLQALAEQQSRIRELLDGKTVRKVIAVPDKLVNFVVK
jgi:leucyl-tRNA synthetase